MRFIIKGDGHISYRDEEGLKRYQTHTQDIQEYLNDCE